MWSRTGNNGINREMWSTVEQRTVEEKQRKKNTNGRIKQKIVEQWLSTIRIIVHKEDRK
jgi:hypothetical protein